MKKLLLVCALILLPTVIVASGAQNLIFCETFGNDWKPVKEGSELNTLSISFIASLGKPIGSSKILMSMYRVVGEEEKLVQRNDVEVNPSWDTLGIRQLELPEDGLYHIVLTSPDGTALQDGKLRVASAKKNDTGTKQKSQGTRIENLFNKYAPKTE